MVSAAFKVPVVENYKNDSFLSVPYASFVGRVSEAVVQNENDCKFGANLLEYNNFNFGNRERMNFNIQVVYEAGPDSRFRKLASRLTIGKFVFISGFFDLNENEPPFIEAKEIDLIDDISNNSLLSNQSNASYQSPFSRAYKFKNSKNIIQSPIKKDKALDGNEVKIVNDNNHNPENELVTASTSTSKANNLLTPQKTNRNPKRKKESEEQHSNKANKRTNVKTRSQKQKGNGKSNQLQDNLNLTEAEEST